MSFEPPISVRANRFISKTKNHYYPTICNTPSSFPLTSTPILTHITHYLSILVNKQKNGKSTTSTKPCNWEIGGFDFKNNIKYNRKIIFFLHLFKKKNDGIRIHGAITKPLSWCIKSALATSHIALHFQLSWAVRELRYLHPLWSKIDAAGRTHAHAHQVNS